MLCLHNVLWPQNSNELCRKLCPRIIPVWFLQFKWILIWIILRLPLQNSRHQLFKFRCCTLYIWTQNDTELLITLLHTLTANVTYGTVRGWEWDPAIWFFFLCDPKELFVALFCQVTFICHPSRVWNWQPNSDGQRQLTQWATKAHFWASKHFWGHWDLSSLSQKHFSWVLFTRWHKCIRDWFRKVFSAVLLLML